MAGRKGGYSPLFHDGRRVDEMLELRVDIRHSFMVDEKVDKMVDERPD